MPLVQDRSRAQLAFQVAGGDVGRFQVVRFRGTEGLCQLYRFEIDLVTSDTAVAFDDIVGKASAFSINTPEGERFFHGLISRFELTDQTQDQLQFRAELVPGIWLLTHRYSARIFQKKTVKEIITSVLTAAGFAADRFKFALSRTYQPREYCVQYRETDYNFISRLMEEEGIWWHFEQTKESHVLTMADAPAAYAPIPGTAQVPFVGASGMVSQAEHVFRFRLGQAVRPGAVVLNDFNFEKPPLKLESKSNAGRDPGLEFFDYPGEYTEQSAGKDLAELRMQEFEASRIIGAGLSTSRRFAPARTFELTEHPVTTLNAKYLLTACTHQGKEATLRATTGTFGRASILDGRTYQSVLAAQRSDNEQIRQLAEALLQVAGRLRAGDATANRALTHWVYHAGQVSRDLANVAAATGASPLEALSLRNLIEDVAQSSVVDYDAPVYECRFECIPAAVTYRPPRVTPWPVMRGSQTARVVGPDGEEIHTDKFGRVKVQFNWDREGDEGGQPKLFGADSSCWIRVAQGSAGGQYGIMFIPRVGQEVIVDFLEGDPDKPIITGRVYNADHMPPYELPKEKTKSIIKTHSSKGGGGTNEIRFEDLKDKEQLFIQAQRQMDLHVKASHFHTVGGSYHLIVGGEKDGELFGEYRQKVFKIKQTHVQGERRAWVEKNDGLEVDEARSEAFGSLSCTVGKDVVEDFQANHKHEVAATWTSKANEISIEAGTTLVLKGPGGTITIAGGGIYIVGTMVYINSGSGPAVAPISATAGGPALVDDPGGADSSKPGKDTHYTGPSAAPPAIPPAPEVPGTVFPPSAPPAPVKTHFIEIQLFDEANQPVAGERYEITTPDGKKRTGATDNNGLARETGLQPGTCQIRFPNLDSEAVTRI